MSKPSDKLIEGCLKGKTGAQKKLFECYRNAMLGICLRYVRDRMEAEDMMLEGFVNIFRKMHTYAHKGSFEGWMKKTMVYSAIDYYRKYKKEKFHSNIDEHEDLIPEDPEILHEIGAAELVQLISKLPAGYRQVFNLFAVEGYSHKEIAELLGISENTSKSQYRKARHQLVSKLHKINEFEQKHEQNKI